MKNPTVTIDRKKFKLKISLKERFPGNLPLGEVRKVIVGGLTKWPEIED